MKKFDTVIIGSGMSGLVTASILSKEGQSVCVLEKHSQPGGLLQTFRRGGVVFETGIHYICNMEKGDTFYQVLNYLGIADKLRLKKLDESGFDTVLIQGEKKEYKFPIGIQNFEKQMIAYFPDEKLGIQKYCNTLKKINQSFSLHNLQIDASNNYAEKYFSMSVGEFLDSCTSNQLLQTVLTGNNLLYGGEKYKLPLYYHAIIIYSYIQGAWRLIDKSDKIAELLVEVITKNGGEVKTRSEAEAFLPNEHKKIMAVKLTNGEKILAKNFISTIHPQKTVQMLPEKTIRKVYRERVNGLENTMSCFSIYAKMKKNKFPYLNSNHYFIKKDFAWETAHYREIDWPYNYFFSTPPKTKNDKFAETAHILSYMSFNEVKKWENTKVGRRGEEYKQFMQEKADMLLELLEKKFPGFREKTTAYYTSSPLTFRDYTGTVEGGIYGLAKTSKERYKNTLSYRTKIPNLFLSGQSIGIHGMMGVTMGAILSCGELINLKELIINIKNA